MENQPTTTTTKKAKMQLLEEEGVQCRLFTKVTNASELSALIKKRDPEHAQLALLSGKVILHPLQLKVAVHRAVHAHHNTKLITNSLASEVVFVVSGNNSTSQAFRKFAVNEGDESVVVVLFEANEEKWGKVRELVKGNEVPVEDIPGELEKGADVETLISYYNLAKNPAAKESKEVLLSAIVTAVASQKI